MVAKQQAMLQTNLKLNFGIESLNQNETSVPFVKEDWGRFGQLRNLKDRSRGLDHEERNRLDLLDKKKKSISMHELLRSYISFTCFVPHGFQAYCQGKS